MDSRRDLHDTDASPMTPAQGETFHLFSSLPKELRLQIWEEAVPRERLIRISVKPHEGHRYARAVAEPRYLQRNALGKPISGERYRAVVPGRSLNSKFLRVNSEARKAALDFYRVHIPVYLTGPSYTERTTLYFNPEHDFLHIHADAPVKETLIDFLFDLKAYDPKDVGLLKLAVDLAGLCANDLRYLKPSDLFLIRQRRTLEETLSQLREVWFVQTPSLRKCTGHVVQTPYISEPPRGQGQAMTMLDGAPTFERLGADPSIEEEEELENVCMGEIDPRELLFRWRILVEMWRAQTEPQKTQYQLLVARASARGRPGRQDGEAHRDGQDPNLQDIVDHGLSASNCLVEEGSGQDRKAPAAGFWLFPTHVVGELQEGEKLSDMDFRPGRTFDLRLFRRRRF